MPTTTPQPIQFLLHQLATNKHDLKSINQSKLFKVKKEGKQLFLYYKNFTGELASDDFTGGGYLLDSVFQNPNLEILAIEFIRTCLSRVNNQSVLDIFGGILGVKIYEEFDRELFVSKPLDKAISSLGDKMLELVPEYREFLKK